MLMDYLYLLISHQALAYFHVYNFSYRAREKVKVDEKDEKIAELMEEITTLKASVWSSSASLMELPTLPDIPLI